jgi:hypothetical protein
VEQKLQASGVEAAVIRARRYRSWARVLQKEW